MPAYTSTQLRGKAITLAITLVSSAFGQTSADETVNRVLRFAHIAEPQSMMEISTVIRSTGEIRHVFADASSRTLTLRGTPEQIALAEWLFAKLDQPSTAKHPPEQAYQMAGTSEGVVRILYPAGIDTVQNLQEFAVLIRSICQIRRAFTFNASKAIVMRGTADEIAMAEWLFNELDRTTATKPAPREYRAAGTEADVVRVFYLTQAMTPAELQESATFIRKTAMIRQMLTYNSSRAMAVRGTPDQLAHAERLIKERYPVSF